MRAGCSPDSAIVRAGRTGVLHRAAGAWRRRPVWLWRCRQVPPGRLPAAAPAGHQAAKCGVCRGGRELDARQVSGSWQGSPPLPHAPSPRRRASATCSGWLLTHTASSLVACSQVVLEQTGRVGLDSRLLWTSNTLELPRGAAAAAAHQGTLALRQAASVKCGELCRFAWCLAAEPSGRALSGPNH